MAGKGKNAKKLRLPLFKQFWRLTMRGSRRLFLNVLAVKEKQRKCIELSFKRKDILGLHPTGLGKSLIHQLFPSIFEAMNGKGVHVLVVSAIKAILNEQFEEQNYLGISAGEVGISEREDVKIFWGEYSMIFGSTEMLLEKEWMEKFKKSKLVGTVKLLVVDEARYLRLGENLFPIDSIRLNQWFSCCYVKF